MKNSNKLPDNNNAARPKVVFAILGFLVLVLVLVGMAVWSPQHNKPNAPASIVATDPAPSQELVAVSTSSAGSNESVSVAAPNSTSSSGLITLRLNPSFSKKLPSPEDAQKALAMNNQFVKTQQNGQ